MINLAVFRSCRSLYRFELYVPVKLHIRSSHLKVRICAVSVETDARIKSVERIVFMANYCSSEMSEKARKKAARSSNIDDAGDTDLRNFVLLLLHVALMHHDLRFVVAGFENNVVLLLAGDDACVA